MAATHQSVLTFQGLPQVGEEASKSLQVKIVHLAVIKDLGWDVSLCKEGKARPIVSPAGRPFQKA